MHRLALIGAGLLLALTAISPAPALAAAPALPPTGVLPIAQPIQALSAHAGWVVWTSPRGATRNRWGAPARWDLVAMHDGWTKTYRIPTRPLPFDVDTGSDARGRPVATFSRCARYGDGLHGLTPDRGCRIRVLDLATGHERAAGEPRGAAGFSDHDPSMWRGRLVFARHRGARDVPMAWSPGRSDAPRALAVAVVDGHGGSAASVRAIDAGARLATFLWGVNDRTTMVRADPLDGSRGKQIGPTYTSGEACTAGPGALDGAGPLRPAVDGLRVRFAVLGSSCYVFRSFVFGGSWAAPLGSQTPYPGTVLQAAFDGHDMYALVAPPNAPNEDPTCTAAAPCTLERTTL